VTAAAVHLPQVDQFDRYMAALSAFLAGETPRP